MEKKKIRDKFEKAELIVDRTEMFLKKLKKLICTIFGIFISLWVSFCLYEEELKKEEILLLNDTRNKVIDKISIQEERLINLEKDKVAHIDLAKILILNEYKNVLKSKGKKFNTTNVEQIKKYLYSGLLNNEKDLIDKASFVIHSYDEYNFQKLR